MINFNESFKDKLKQQIKNQLKWWGQKSYSQEGEDLILARIFEHTKNGTYIDIGAHHPQRFSNTFFFYEKGWSGLNIDAAPGSMDVFKKLRPRDINIEAAVSDTQEMLTYHMFSDGALNTLSKDVAKNIISKNDEFKLIKEISIHTKTLESILDQSWDKNKKINFMSIDVEGLDLKVLKSNNWKNFSPEILLVESHGYNIEDLEKNEIYCYLRKAGYKLLAKTINTFIFRNYSA